MPKTFKQFADGLTGQKDIVYKGYRIRVSPFDEMERWIEKDGFTISRARGQSVAAMKQTIDQLVD